MHAKDVPGLKETVRQYEEKLATISVFNDALQKENQKLRESLEESQAPKSATDQEVQELKSEFARRMATVERDKARLKEKNDQLRTKLTSLSQGGSSTQARLKEREDYIASLQKEGEALARKNGELEANLRKLRAGSQEGEAERLRLLNRLKQQDGILDSERERSEKVAAQQSQKVAQLQTELEALQQTATEQIHAALREGAGAAQAALDQAKRGGDSALQDSLHREASLADQLERSRLEKEESEAHWSEQEELLRREIHTLETKIMAQEVQVSESLSDASAGNKDLLRQIEAMAAASRLQNETHALAESKLHMQIRNLQAAEMEARAAESSCMEKLSSQAQALENLGTALHEEQELRGGVEIRMSSEEKRCKDLAEQCTDLEQDLLKLKAKLEAESVQHDTTKLDLQKQLWHAEEQAASLRQELGDANKRIEAVSQNKAAKSRESSGLEGETTDHPLDFREVNGTAHSVSAPTSDPQKEASLDTHLSRLFWPGDSETVARSSQKNGVIKGHREKNASDMELLQKRVSNAEILAELAQEELFKACKRAEQYQSDANKFTHAQNALQALRAQHDLALELLGERNERVDSLEDDIQEMKHLFHTQLSSLVDELNSLRGGLG